VASAAKKSARATKEGIIAQNIQAGARAGVLLEINCETDFVARSEQFIKFAHEVALQVAAAAPRYIKEEDIPAEVLEHETEIAKGRAREEGKPEAMLEKIAQGRLEKFKDEVVLLRQPYIRDDKVTIGKLLLEQVASIGENIVVRRIVRWELGEVSG
jgi:elongation factor Ts